MSEEFRRNIYIQLALGLLIIGAVAGYLFWFSNGALGPYGDPQDIYHLIILVGTLFMVLILVQIWRKVEQIE